MYVEDFMWLYELVCLLVVGGFEYYGKLPEQQQHSWHG